jgi:hypothetical protein
MSDYWKVGFRSVIIVNGEGQIVLFDFLFCQRIHAVSRFSPTIYNYFIILALCILVFHRFVKL